MVGAMKTVAGQVVPVVASRLNYFGKPIFDPRPFADGSVQGRVREPFILPLLSHGPGAGRMCHGFAVGVSQASCFFGLV